MGRRFGRWAGVAGMAAAMAWGGWGCVGMAGKMLAVPGPSDWTVKDGAGERDGMAFFREGWRCEGSGDRSLTVDWGRSALVYGFSMRWGEEEPPEEYAVALSRNGKKWETVREKKDAEGGVDEWSLEPRLARAARITVRGKEAARLERFWAIGAQGRPQVRLDGVDTPGALALLDGQAETSWGEGPGEAGMREVQIDWGSARNTLGVRLDWPKDGPPPKSVDVWVSGDGVYWTPLGEAKRDEDEAADLLLGDEERPVRWARLEVERGAEGWALGGVSRRGAEGAGRAWKAYEKSMKEGAAAGALPAAMAGGRPMWTSAAGWERGCGESVLTADGGWAPEKGGPSLWAVARAGEKWLSPGEAETAEYGVAGPGAPMPTAKWTWKGGASLEVRAMETPEGAWSEWTLANGGEEPIEGEWGWAVRPMRAAPPWAGGGVSPVARVRGAENGGWQEIRVNGAPWVGTEGEGWAFGAAGRAAGGETAAWKGASGAAGAGNGKGARDAEGLASAVWKRPFSLEPGETARAVLVGAGKKKDWPTGAGERFGETWEARAKGWAAVGEGYAPKLGMDAETEALQRMQLSWVVGARGTAGTPEESMARMTALLYGGRTDEARAEARQWVAAAKGALGEGGVGTEARQMAADRERHTLSPAVCGQFVHGVAEAWRFSGDRELLEEAYPVMRRAMLDVAALTEKPPKGPPLWSRFWRWIVGNRGAPPAAGTSVGPAFGLVADRAAGAGGVAVHETSVQLWALLAWKDLRDAARALGRAEDAEWAESQAAALRDALRFALAVASRGAVHPRVAASVESPDGPGGSTAAAMTVWPCGEEGVASAAMVQNTLDGVYARFLRWAVEGEGSGMAFTGDIAYLTALARAGYRDYAGEMMRDLCGLVKPAAWGAPGAVAATGRGTGEGVRESAKPDVRTAATLYAALRQAAACEEGGRLHLLCGAPPEWMRGEAGFAVKGASTAWGKLDLRARERGKLFRAEIGGGAAPPEGYRLWWPRGEAPERVLVARRATKEFGVLYIDLPGDFKGVVEGFYAEETPELRGE